MRSGNDEVQQTGVICDTAGRDSFARRRNRRYTEDRAAKSGRSSPPAGRERADPLR